jgi:hypothetical protein
MLREKNRIESPMPISNENLVNELYSLLAKSELGILKLVLIAEGLR